MRNLGLIAASLLAACGYSGDPEATFFQPVSATASTERSDDFLIDYTIDGSGLPNDFGPEDDHRSYRALNHWTTDEGEVEGSWAWYEFDQTVIVDTLYLWNHRSTSPPAFSEDYAISRFDLELFDGDDRRVGEVRGLTSEGGRADAQIFEFDPVEGVRSVRLGVVENEGEPRATGLAEIAFGGVR